jgi:catalase
VILLNEKNKNMTTNQGVPVRDNQNSRTAGEHGPTVIEDYHLIEKLAHFDRERIPERVVHARGAGAHGTFTVTADVSKYTKAAFLSEVGKVTQVFTRLSTVIHGQGSPETARDPRGFSIKFYTEEGNYDIVGNSLPVFFIRDAIKFPDVIHALKPAPDTNIQDPDRYWDFMSLTPESTHMMTWLFSDEGVPATYRHMDGFSVHAFKWVNKEGKATYVKYHWKTRQGQRGLALDEIEKVQGKDFNHATRDMYTSIQDGNFPVWDFYVQYLEVDDFEKLDFDPLDDTKIWPEDLYPKHKFGELELNRNPENFFEEVEQAAFSPGVVVPGIEPSEDKMLQGRLFSYSDTQRYRLGANYLQIPVNCPHARVQNHQRDGFMQMSQQKSPFNYEPNRHQNYDELIEAKEDQFKESEPILQGTVRRKKMTKENNYAQAGEKFRELTPKHQEHLIKNIVNDFEKVNDQTVLLMTSHFYLADEEFGTRLAAALDLNVEDVKAKAKEESKQEVSI